ncbi:MAG TPA: hypothetical protein VJ922_05530 [Actinomycetota bacterium]|nr:hypothetical protein [Actinomycetota bacterium]
MDPVWPSEVARLDRLVATSDEEIYPSTQDADASVDHLDDQAIGVDDLWARLDQLSITPRCALSIDRDRDRFRGVPTDPTEDHLDLFPVGQHGLELRLDLVAAVRGHFTLDLGWPDRARSHPDAAIGPVVDARARAIRERS